MPGTNPAFVGQDGLVSIYRGGVAGAWEARGIKRGYLISKLMNQWACEGVPQQSDIGGLGGKLLLDKYKVPLLIESISSVFEKEVNTGVVMPDGPYQGLTLVIPQIPKSVFTATDLRTREQHAVSSSPSDSGTMKTGFSAYVSLSHNIKKAQEFLGTNTMMWRFDICKSDLFEGNTIEEEKLGLGGTPIFNIFCSHDQGVSFTESFGNGDHAAL